MIAGSMAPIAYLLAGPLVERVFAPLLVPGGALVGSLGAMFGVGAGRGIGLLMSVLGVALLATSLIAFLLPSVRHVEDELPDMVPDPIVAHPEASAEPL
jgi:MFS transporter, DHA3 family, macrolide efflux protein